MIRPVSLLIALLAAVGADAATAAPDSALMAKAGRAYADCEWASAAALYNMAADKDPGDTEAYVRATICHAIRKDTAEAVGTIERAMAHAVPLDSILKGLRSEAFEIKKPEIYTGLLETAGNNMPWLRRPLDMQLMRYAAYRRDPEAMERYAARMLAGMPGDTEAMAILAKAHAMQGRFDEAITDWQRVLAAKPDDRRALLEIGNYYAITGDSERALPYLEKAQAVKATPYVAEMIHKLRATQ